MYSTTGHRPQLVSYMPLHVLICLFSSFLANTILARAEEDELDDVVDIEGEDNQVVGDDALGDDDDSVVKSSQDVDTTILFTKPIPMYGDVAFGKILCIFMIS